MCAGVMRGAVRALSPGIHPSAALTAWASLPALYHRWAMGPGGEAYLLAVAGPRVLGYGARRAGELTAVFVRPGAQGRGVGRRLVEALCAAAAREGHRSAHVLAARAAVRFYAALGFTGRRAVSVPLPGGRSLAAVAMRLRLGPEPAWHQARRSRTSLPRPRQPEVTAARRAAGRDSGGSRPRRRGAGRTPRRRGSVPDRPATPAWR